MPKRYTLTIGEVSQDKTIDASAGIYAYAGGDATLTTDVATDTPIDMVNAAYSYLGGSAILTADTAPTGSAIYVDKTVAQSTTYDPITRTIGSGTQPVYQTVQAAVNAMATGDDTYIRGSNDGNNPEKYLENVNIRGATTPWGTPSDYCSLQSYPDEWAEIDGQHITEYAIGRLRSGRSPGNDMAYWRFERLGITGGCTLNGNQGGAGIYMSGHHITVRLCNIHDNSVNDVTANPGGIVGYVWNNWLIEYNNFFNNGGTLDGNQAHITIFTDNFSGGTPERRLYDINKAVHSNEIRYNFFDTAYVGFRHKNRQYLCDDSGTDFEFKEYGDKIHHNIWKNHNLIGGDQGAIVPNQDFAQVYNNIVDVGNVLHAELGGNTKVKYHIDDYNNTVITGCLRAPIGWTTLLDPANPYVRIINNIVDSELSGSLRSEIIVFARMLPAGEFIGDNMTVDRNLIYDPPDSTNFSIGSPTATGDPSGLFDAAGINASYGVTNWERPRPGLYVGTTGADQYITNPTFTLSGGANISNGGLGGPHAYLDGVTYPSYVGAVDPLDQGWVDGLYTDARNPDFLRQQPIGSTPTW